MAYKYLQEYKRPSSYMGPDWPDHYAVAGQSRDSSHLEASNFAACLKALGGETGEDDDGIADVVVVRDHHWAVGWVETLRVAKRRADLCQVADDLLGQLDDYPVLDEDDFSRREWECAEDTWEHMTVADRVDAIHRSHTRGVSVFAARRAEFPQGDDNGGLFEYCRGE